MTDLTWAWINRIFFPLFAFLFGYASSQHNPIAIPLFVVTVLTLWVSIKTYKL